MFVCFFFIEVYCPTWHFFHLYGAVPITDEGLQIFNLCTALMAIERRGFFSVPLLLWHWTSVYILPEPVILTPIAERLAVKLPQIISTT